MTYEELIEESITRNIAFSANMVGVRCYVTIEFEFEGMAHIIDIYSSDNQNEWKFRYRPLLIEEHVLKSTNAPDAIDECIDIMYQTSASKHEFISNIKKKIQMQMQVNISLDNEQLYKDCEIETVAGRKNLTTPIPLAIEIVGKNIAEMNLSGDTITLTGAMAVWSYLVTFHAVVHRFRRVYYDDGRNGAVLVAAHG